LFSDKGKISGILFSERMDLVMFDRFCPSLETRAQLEERRCDINRSNRNSERYVIPMHRKKKWTNKWMSDPRNNFLQVHQCDPNAQYRKGRGSFKMKRGLTLFIVAEYRDILLRNSLVEVLFSFVVKLLDMKFWISLE
jgi:hypothetical protein